MNLRHCSTTVSREVRRCGEAWPRGRHHHATSYGTSATHAPYDDFGEDAVRAPPPTRCRARGKHLGSPFSCHAPGEPPPKSLHGGRRGESASRTPQAALSYSEEAHEARRVPAGRRDVCRGGNRPGSAAVGAASFADQEPRQRGIAAAAERQLRGDRGARVQGGQGQDAASGHGSPGSSHQRREGTFRVAGRPEIFRAASDELCGQRHARQRPFRAVPE